MPNITGYGNDKSGDLGVTGPLTIISYSDTVVRLDPWMETINLNQDNCFELKLRCPW